MGIWYVNAHIPTSFESNCKNAVEFYRWLNAEKPHERPGIQNRFFCEPATSRTSKNVLLNGYAWVHDLETFSHWKIEFFWPLAFDYRVMGLSDDYQEVMIGHPSRQYLWIMSRSTKMSSERIEYWMKKAEAQGFKRSELRIVPFDPTFQMSSERLDQIFNKK